jgi:hypothetical protein
MKFTEESTAAGIKAALDSKDAFIVDNGKTVFTWIGKGASPSKHFTYLKQGIQYI